MLTLEDRRILWESPDPAALVNLLEGCACGHRAHAMEACQADCPCVKHRCVVPAVELENKLDRWVWACRGLVYGRKHWPILWPDSLMVTVQDWATNCTGYKKEVPFSLRADLLREVFGNPFDPAPPLFAGPTAVSLARAALEDPDDHGVLDGTRLTILADALEEDGHEDLSSHFRGGVHVSACWGLRLILGDS